jgi:hypothetical protein
MARKLISRAQLRISMEQSLTSFFANLVIDLKDPLRSPYFHWDFDNVYAVLKHDQMSMLTASTISGRCFSLTILDSSIYYQTTDTDEPMRSRVQHVDID